MKALTLMISSVMVASLLLILSCENLNYDAHEDYGEEYKPEKIYMFATDSVFSGNLGGRSGADEKCHAQYKSKYTHLNAKYVRAFINVNTEDEMRDMPGNYGVPINLPIVGPENHVISNLWGDLLSGTLSVTLNDAKVISALGGQIFWSGSDDSGNGIVDTNNTCQEWSTDSGVNVQGSSNVKVPYNAPPVLYWLRYTGSYGCGCINCFLVCVAW